MYVAHREHTPLGARGMAQDAFGSPQALSSDLFPATLIFPFTLYGPGSHIGEVNGTYADDEGVVADGG